MYCKWEGDKLSGKRFKIFFPASAWAEKKRNSAVQNGTVVFFLKERKCNLKEEKNFKSDPKMGYDNFNG
jgi:hypothetical protein